MGNVLIAANILGEILGAIERGLGSVLNAIYSVVHNYAIAIILLTVAVRSLLIPLTVKQIRSMGAMQTIQPELKKVQQKYKQLQQKSKDRMEVQQLRMQMNQEMQTLYKAHGVNPLGGCFPLLAQMPVYIAMFAIMRAAVFAVPATVTPTPNLTAKDAKNVICRPWDDTRKDFLTPDPAGPTPSKVKCENDNGQPVGSPDGVFTIGQLKEGRASNGPVVTNAGWITQCRPTGVPATPLVCQSAVGTGHLPRDGKLFADVTKDKASVFGMHPGCSASQVASKTRIKECFASGKGGTTQAIPYWLLVALIVGTQYVQGKQMAARASGPQAQQQQMMTRIMPVFLGVISLQLPAGANLYFFVQNLWMIGQQHLLLSKQQAPVGTGKSAPKAELPAEKAKEEAKPTPAPAKQQGSKKRKRKKK
jgi:YidC/Oxa1 family membrane protein insertase